MNTNNKPWLSHYPAGVAPEISLGSYPSLLELIEESCTKYADLPAFTNMGYSITFSELRQLYDSFAAFLQKELGLKKGDRIAIQMPNLIQYPVVLFGALKAGLVVVNTNPLYTQREMAHQFKDSGVKAIVILENFADKLEAILKETQIEHVIMTEIGDALPGFKRLLTNLVVRYVKKMVPSNSVKCIRYRDALERGRHNTFQRVPLQRSDLAFLQYTGGTTGVSKGAMLSHENILGNLLQISEWLKPKLETGCENLISALPLYHIFCLTVNCLGLLKIGVNNILITNPRDIPAFLKILRTSKPTVMTAVSTLLGGMLNHKDFDTVDWSTLKVTVAGGMALKQSVAEEWKRRTKTPVIEGYGLTETSPVVCCNPLDGRDRIGTIGLPIPSTEVKVIDENGLDLPHGKEGELCVKGPQVMVGYWEQPEETAKIMTPDGWLKTGDIAVMSPDGFFKIVDRKKDMILVSGFNVYPNEVEDVIMKHPKVLEAAAIAMPDEHSGEAVQLFIVPKDPSLTAEEVKAYCRQNLTAYKCPKAIEFRKELPKTNVGKILRRMLREPQTSNDSAGQR